PQARDAAHLPALRAPHLAHEIELALAGAGTAARIELQQNPFSLERGMRRQPGRTRREQRAVVSRGARSEVEVPDDPACYERQQEESSKQGEFQAPAAFLFRYLIFQF